MLQIGVLGDLEVVSGGRAVELHQHKLRTLVCSMVIDAGRFVPVDVLEDRLWGDERPASSRKLIQTHVSRLRHLLSDDADAIDTSGGRYRLSSTSIDLDVDRFERQSAEAAEVSHEGRFGEAVALYRNALALWRGRAFIDVGGMTWAQPESVRLEEERLMAWERLIDAELRQGHHLDVVPELTELVMLNPLRETLCASLMVSLYRSQRQAEALAAFRLLRNRLIDELGVEPTPRLRRLEEAVLRQAPELLDPMLMFV